MSDIRQMVIVEKAETIEGVFPNRPIPLMLFGAQAALTGALKLLWIGCLPAPRTGTSTGCSALSSTDALLLPTRK